MGDLLTSWGSKMLLKNPYSKTADWYKMDLETAVENVHQVLAGWHSISIHVRHSRFGVADAPVILLAQPVCPSLPSVCFSLHSVCSSPPSVCQSQVCSQKAWNFEPAELHIMIISLCEIITIYVAVKFVTLEGSNEHV